MTCEQVGVLRQSNLFQPVLKIGHLGNPNATGDCANQTYGGTATPRKGKLSCAQILL